jgi:hypothetical protein
MKYLRYALIFFFVVDVLMFVVYQTAPESLATALPQFDVESVGNTYPRLVGNLFLMLGIARLYGGLFIQQKGAFTVSMWSWVVELIYTVTELCRGQFALSENVMALVLAPLMLGWSLFYYRKTFLFVDSN